MTEYAGYVPPEALQNYSADIGVDDAKSDAKIAAADAEIISEDTPAITVPEGVEPQGLTEDQADNLINQPDFKVETTIIEDEAVGIDMTKVPEPPTLETPADIVDKINQDVKKSLEGDMSAQMAA